MVPLSTLTLALESFIFAFYHWLTAKITGTRLSFLRHSSQFNDRTFKLQHLNTQFGLDFSNIDPNEANQRFLGNAMFEPFMTPFNASAIANSWIVTGNRRSRCFRVGSGSLQVIFNDTMMLHGLYGGVDGRPVNAGDFLLYGFIAIFDACPQQPILIQSQSDIPARVLPVEGWLIEESRLYNRQLGRGRSQNTVKNTISQDDPAMVMITDQLVISFP